MIKYLKKLWKSKIEINIHIVYPVDGVKRITEPEIIRRDTVSITRHRQSDLRFVEMHRVDHFGNGRSVWYTERYENGYWSFCEDSLSSNRNEAMALHQKILERGTLKPITTIEVEWEGLGKEETLSWIAMNKTDE